MARIPPSTCVIRRGCPPCRGRNRCGRSPRCRLVVVFVATSSSFLSPSSSPSLSSSLLLLPTSLRAVIPMATARRRGRGGGRARRSWPPPGLSDCHRGANLCSSSSSLSPSPTSLCAILLVARMRWAGRGHWPRAVPLASLHYLTQDTGGR